jgi:hypothetical protein
MKIETLEDGSCKVTSNAGNSYLLTPEALAALPQTPGELFRALAPFHGRNAAITLADLVSRDIVCPDPNQRWGGAEVLLFKDVASQDENRIEEAIDFALSFAGYDEDDFTLPNSYVWYGEGWGVFSNDVMTGFFETEDAARTAAAPGEVIQEATGWYIVKGECPMPEPQSSACKPDTPEGSGSLHRIVRRRPSEWEQITGIKILDPDGWRDGTRWETPLTEREWKERMQKSTRSYTPNSRDDGGPEASSTSSETLAAFVDEAAARAECEKINQANRPTPTIVILPRGVKFNGFEDLGTGRGTSRLFEVFVSFDGEEFTGRGWGETSYGRSGDGGLWRALEDAMHEAGFTDWTIKNSEVKKLSDKLITCEA